MKGRKYRVYTGASGSRFVANDKLGPIIAHISKTSGCEVTRVYAGQDAATLIHAIGLHTQEEVKRLSDAGTPGYGPANPPDQSTHCERNDGVAYRLPRRAWVPWWGCGMDLKISEIPNFIRHAAQDHQLVTRTYPFSRGEAQHCNFRRAPKLPNIWKSKPLRHLSQGNRVRFITRMLVKIPDSSGRLYLTEPSNTMTERVVDAVKKFQREHHQKADGVVGVQTRAQIVASYRWHQKNK
jgi:hypothetical protein